MYLFLDTETTDVSENQDARLIQVACTFGGDRFESLFRTDQDIKLMAMATHHITGDMLQGKEYFTDSTFKQTLQRFLQDSILVAHNAKFDVEFLKREGVEVPRHICTMKLAQHLDDTGEFENYQLQYLRYLFGCKFEEKINPHDALSDVLVLEKVFEKLSKNLTEQEMLEITEKPVLLPRCHFKKHKGELWKDVANEDIGYLQWMKREMKDMSEDLAYTVDYYLAEHEQAIKNAF